MPETLTVAAVLKSGGDYTLDHAVRLFNAVDRNMQTPHRIALLTDHELREWAEWVNPWAADVHRLLRDWPGWWSKMELFRLPGPVLFFDLDTVITGELDTLADAVLSSPPDLFAMLRDFNSGHPASGVMAWQGDRSDILLAFMRDWNGSARRLRGDQDWLRQYWKEQRIRPTFLQDLVPPNYIVSYKNDLRRKNAIPQTDTSVVAFHGLPRPFSLDPMPPWMIEHWR